MLLIAIKGHDYENKWRSPGDLYEAAEQYVLGLVSSGHARKAEWTADSPRPEPVSVVAASEETKRHYKRRDMRPIE